MFGRKPKFCRSCGKQFIKKTYFDNYSSKTGAKEAAIIYLREGLCK